MIRITLSIFVLAILQLPTLSAQEATGGVFETRRLTDQFHAEGAAAGDLNNDGHPDVVYGPFWWEGPDFKKEHRLYKPAPFALTIYSNNFFPHVRDLDGDGWNDILVLGFPGRENGTYWFQNPGKVDGAWQKHVVQNGPENESPHYADVDGDGEPEIVCSFGGRFCLVRPDGDDATKPWKATPISPEGSTGGRFTHGLGLGDVNGDGLIDLLEKTGWWEHKKGELWQKHAYPFSAPGGAQMYAYDFDGDGDNDIITSLAAHSFGLAWFEQVKNEEGAIDFKRHMIMGSNPDDSDYGLAFSQLHGVDLVDVDGDGVKDLVTGKRFFAHNGNDPGGKDAPVIYWFKTVRGGEPGDVEFVPHLVDDDSGVGVEVKHAELNGDRRPDIIVGNKKGCFIHLSKPGKAEPVAKVGKKVREEIEGEDLAILKKTGNPRPQAMGNFGAGIWSGESQLWWTGAKPGDVLELQLPATKAGLHQVSVAMTKAVDYGIVQFSLDGKEISEPIDLFQPEGVSHTGEVLLGTIELKEGNHVLSVKIVGTNPNAKKAFMFGLDFVKLKHLDAKADIIFDGKTLSGWEGDAKWWRVEDGSIVGEIPADGQLGKNQFLFWNGEVHDFDLTLHYRITGGESANSGIQYRSKKTAGGGATGYQADLDHGAVWAGRIYDEHGRGLINERGFKVNIDPTGGREEKPFRDPKEYEDLVKKGEWNTYRIRAIGPRMQTWLNGQPASDLTDLQNGQLDFSGKLAIQLHSGPGPAKIEFKDIQLTQLGKTEPPEPEPIAMLDRDGISPKELNLGFEKGTLEGWKATGDVWTGSPIEGDTVTPRRPGQASEHDGKFWIGGYERTKSDAQTGTLTSDPFEVTHAWGSFLIGAGPNAETRVELIDSDSKEVFFKTSGSRELENMYPVFVDLSERRGKKIQIRIVDEHTGHWGHINFDDFRFHNAKPKPQEQRPPRIASNPLLKHLRPNPAEEDADSTVANMWVPKGFAVDLIAKEPDVTQPIAFTFDERGRLWVAEAHSYPRRQPEGEGKDSIVIFEDADGDGSFEKKTTFAEGLNLVSGFEVGFGGVWVGAAPEFLFIPDKDGDDKPDGKPVVLLDGWGYRDTHETLNSFIWGPDGWLYGNQGVFNHSLIGKPGTPNNERLELRAGVWRYHPQSHEFEIFSYGCSNQWGIDFNEVGAMFITHCRSAWGGGPISYVVQNGHYWNQANAHHAPFVAAGPAGWNPGKEKIFRNFLMASAKYGHGEGGAGKAGSRALYGGHAHVGSMVYLGGNWPEEYRDQLFTHNLHGHQMNREINVRRGSGYETVHADTDMLLIPDQRFIGVDLKYGPDGAVYMIDWYDKQHCHTNNTEAWDRSDGRIYRMAWTETFKPVKVDIGKLSTAELVEMVTSKDEWYSRNARRVLQERGDAEAGPALQKALASAEEVPVILRLMWALHITETGIPAELLQHENEYVRSWAIRLLSEGDLPGELLLAMAEEDPSQMVRLGLASTLPFLDDNTRWSLAENLAARPEDVGDDYLPKMIWYGIAPLANSDPARAMRIADGTPLTVLSDSIIWYLTRNAAGREQIAKRLLTASDQEASRTLGLMAYSLPTSGKLPAPEGWLEIVAKHRNPETQGAINRLSGLFGDMGILTEMRQAVVDKSLPLAKRKEAFDFLKGAGDDGCAEEFVELLAAPEFRSSVVPLLGRFNDAKVAEVLIGLIPELAIQDRNAALGALSSKPILAGSLLKAIEKGEVDSSLLTSLHIRQMQNLGDEKVSELLTSAYGTFNETSADAHAAIENYKKLYREKSLLAYDATKGEQIFSQVCATCHVRDGKGIPLGPDLTGSHTNGIDYFIENIVDPNAVIGENFQLNVITKKDDTVVSGMPASETDTVLTVRMLTETIEIPKAEIKKRQILEQSMMPAGLLGTLKDEDVVQLLKYLTTK